MPPPLSFHHCSTSLNPYSSPPDHIFLTVYYSSHTRIYFSLLSFWSFTGLPLHTVLILKSLLLHLMPLHIEMLSSCSYLLEWQCQRMIPKSWEIFGVYLQFSFRIHPSLFSSSFYSCLILSVLSPTPFLPLCLIHGVSVCPLLSAASRQTSQTFHCPFLTSLSYPSLPFPVSSVIIKQRPRAVKKYNRPIAAPQKL